MNRAERRRKRKKPQKTAIHAKSRQIENIFPSQQTLVLQEAIDLAVQHHTAGDLSKAEDIYRQILKIDPDQPDALHLLGVIAHQVGEYDRAVDLITKAIVIKPDYAEPSYNLGNVFKELGRLDEAVTSYRKALAIKPNYAEVYSNLSIALQELGKLDESVASCHKALAIKPNYAEAYNNLGNTLQGLEKLDKAVASYHKALAIEPDYAEAYNNLGNALQGLEKLDEAVTSYHKALLIKPDYAEAYNNLGNAFQDMGKQDEVIANYRKALSIRPDYAEAHNNLGVALQGLGRLDEAITSFHKALIINPEFAEVYDNLGNVLKDLGKLEEAIASIYKALAINPNYAQAHNTLGLAFHELGQVDEVIFSYRKALAIEPNFAEAYNNLGIALQEQGELDEAIASYRKALDIKPDFLEAGRNILLVMLYLPGLSPEELFTEHLRFAENHARDVPRPAEDLTNDPTPNRRLRVGYLSSDFRDHPVGRNILPLLSSHDRTKFEVYCYAEVRRPDAITNGFRSCVDHWHTITGQSDAEVARMVRADGIDVLVCLAGRFDSNRPLVCAHRAAPVQVSYHDGATSGLKEMDYFVTDHFLNPPDTEEMFTEELHRLPVFYQYPPIEGAPPTAALPTEQTGFITFASFNNPAKISEEVIHLWAEVLKSVPGSRLLLKYRNLYDQASARDSINERFAVCGIGQGRVMFAVNLDSMKEHLGRYGEVDIALDPFPFNGTTTTFQALWMGVPVVSLAGETFSSRTTGSILHHAELGELVADTPEAYVACAQHLAKDVARLKTLRATLRERITNSPLCDAPTYAGTVETAYRDMWRKWCTQHENTP